MNGEALNVVKQRSIETALGHILSYHFPIFASINTKTSRAMDTKSLINNYVWLIDFIRRRGKVPFKEINKAWQRAGRDGGMELSKRTFLRHINDIADIFGIDIECEGCSEYGYYITYDDSESDSTKTWLLNSMSLHNRQRPHGTIREPVF